MSSKVTELLTKETAGLPNWAWGLVVVGGAGVGYWFVRKNSSSTTAAGSTTTSATGATDTSQAGANAVSQPSDNGGSIDYSSQLGAGANPGSPVYILGTSPGSSGSSPNPPVTQSITIRQRQTSGPNAGYDKNNPGGVPIHQGTSGSSPTVGLQPFGSTVATTGPSVVGSTNSGSGSGGSDYWYPIANGYISSWDVVGIGGGGLLRPNKSITDAMN